MGEVDQLQDAVYEGVAERDEGVDETIGDAGDEEVPEVLGETHSLALLSPIAGPT
jgi:hypothetical protein